MYLEAALDNIDKMPQSTFDEIVEKYVETQKICGEMTQIVSPQFVFLFSQSPHKSHK